MGAQMDEIIKGLAFSISLSFFRPLQKQIWERIKTVKEREGQKCKFLSSSLIRTLTSTRALLTFLIALILTPGKNRSEDTTTATSFFSLSSLVASLPSW